MGFRVGNMLLFSSSVDERKLMNHSFENTGRRGLDQFKAEPFDCVIPAWSAGIQVDMDVSGRVRATLDAGYPCRHDEDLVFPCSVDERKLMNHLVVKSALKS
jgi:hypothetical protein